MKKHIIARTFSIGLVFIAFVLTSNFAIAQDGAGENAARQIQEKADRLTSSQKEFHEAVEKVTQAAVETAKSNPNNADAVKKAARDKLDEEIKNAKGKPYKSELESLKKRWEENELIAEALQRIPEEESEASSEFGQALESGKELDEKAWKKYESAYTEKTPAQQAEAFEAAAAMFDEAAKAYRKEGNEARAKVMDGNARAARSNAENRRIGQQYSDQAGSNTSVPRCRLSINGLLPLGNIDPQKVSLTDLETALHASSIFEPLMERLGSEFSMGDLSGQPSQSFEMKGTTQTMPGLRLGYRLGNRFELRAGGYYFQSKWSGMFPVVVFPQQDPPMPPQTLQGSLSGSSSGVLAEADVAYFLTNGTIRPFLHAGIRGQFSTRNERSATLAGLVIPLETTPFGSTYSPFGGAGLRVGFLKNGFLEANASYGKVPNGEYAPSVGLSVGWRFGTVQKPVEPGETIPLDNVNCNTCLEDGKCACGDISFDVLVTHYSLKIQNDGKKNVREYNIKRPVETAVKEDSQSGVGKDKAQAPAEIKPAIPGLKAGDEVSISLTNLNIDCPCTNGTPCEAYKSELPNTNAGKALLAKITQAIAADAALGNANEEVAKIEKELEAAKTDVAKKNAKNKLQKAKEKVAKLDKELKEAQAVLAAEGLGNPNIKVGGKDASGSWDTTTGVFTFDKNGNYGLKVDKVPFVFEFEVSFKCQSFKCDGVTCTRKFKVTL